MQLLGGATLQASAECLVDDGAGRAAEAAAEASPEAAGSCEALANHGLCFLFVLRNLELAASCVGWLLGSNDMLVIGDAAERDFDKRS